MREREAKAARNHFSGAFRGRITVRPSFRRIWKRTKKKKKKKKKTSSSDIAIDIDNILGIVSLGTFHAAPLIGQTDMTVGAVRATNEKFPAAYFEDKLFMMTIGGKNSEQSGDGIVSLEDMHLEGADQMTLSNVCHAAKLCGSELENVWYGSEKGVIEDRFGNFLDITSAVDHYKEHSKIDSRSQEGSRRLFEAQSCDTFQRYFLL